MNVVLLIVGGIFTIYAVVKLLSERKMKWKTFGLGLVILAVSFNLFGEMLWLTTIKVVFCLTGFVFIIIGIIKGIIWLVTGCPSDDYSSSSSYRSSSGGYSSSSGGYGRSSSAYGASRENDPHICGNCTKYSSSRGECRSTGDPVSDEDSCNNWC